MLLVGDAHYDYKGSIVQVYRKDYDKKYNLYTIFVPTFHGWSPESGETAMDHRFVLLSGDDSLPDMYIGRLPSQYPHELDVVVKKIINYEKNLKRGPWQGRIVEIADNEIDNPGQDDIFEKTRECMNKESATLTWPFATVPGSLAVEKTTCMSQQPLNPLGIQSAYGWDHFYCGAISLTRAAMLSLLLPIH